MPNSVMTITILTLFPEVVKFYIDSSIIGRAQQRGIVKIKITNIRDYASDKHHTVDDRPYSGGPGMLLRVDIVHKAIRANRLKKTACLTELKEKVVLTEASGRLFNQAAARRYSKLDHLLIVAGRYEGIDERIKYFTDEEVSIGRFVLTGGELPAMVISDSVVRLIPGVLKKEKAVIEDSYSVNGQKEAPQYTRPADYLGYKVPEVLLSGDRAKIIAWNIQNRKK